LQEPGNDLHLHHRAQRSPTLLATSRGCRSLRWRRRAARAAEDGGQKGPLRPQRFSHPKGEEGRQSVTGHRWKPSGYTWTQPASQATMHGNSPHGPVGVNLLRRPSAAAPGRNQAVAISPARRMGRTGPHRCRTGPQRVRSFTDVRPALTLAAGKRTVRYRPSAFGCITRSSMTRCTASAQAP
jgi:hypothetical protein